MAQQVASLEATCATVQGHIGRLMTLNDSLVAERNALQAQVGAGRGGCLPGQFAGERAAVQSCAPPPLTCACPPPHAPPHAQVQDLQTQAESTAVVAQASKAQIEGLGKDKAALALQAQELVAALADSRAQVEALARKNSELRWAQERVVAHAWEQVARVPADLQAAPAHPDQRTPLPTLAWPQRRRAGPGGGPKGGGCSAAAAAGGARHAAGGPAG